MNFKTSGVTFVQKYYVGKEALFVTRYKPLKRHWVTEKAED